MKKDLQLEEWQNKWQMSFNPSKCKTICISNKKTPPQRVYSFCGVKLEQVESMSYLGVIFNDDLKWSNHVSTISSKASRVLGMMKRNLWNCPKRVKEIAYTTLCAQNLNTRVLLGIPTFKRTSLLLREFREKQHNFVATIIIPQPVSQTCYTSQRNGEQK